MPRVVIGVPVLNGAHYLERCLRALVAQDHRDLGILISDNASSDATLEIASAFAASDPRIQVVRQISTLSVMDHFRAVLEAADCRFFAWRAHDDWSDPDWVTRLSALLEDGEGTTLAVSRIVVVPENGAAAGEVSFPEALGSTPDDRLRLLYMSAPHWFYGLWRHDALLRLHAAVQARYPHVWSHDHVLVMRAVLSGGVVGTDATCFYSRWSMASNSAYFPTHWREAWRHYADFWAAAHDAARESRLPLGTMLRFYAMMPRHTRARTEKLRRIGRGWLNERLGGQGLTRPKDRQKGCRNLGSA